MTAATDAQGAAAQVLVAEMGAVHATLRGVASIPGAVTVSLFSRDTGTTAVELNPDGTILEVRTTIDRGPRGLEIQDHTNQQLGDRLRAALSAQKDKP